jgi:hypothetical protein
VVALEDRCHLIKLACDRPERNAFHDVWTYGALRVLAATEIRGILTLTGGTGRHRQRRSPGPAPDPGVYRHLDGGNKKAPDDANAAGGLVQSRTVEWLSLAWLHSRRATLRFASWYRAHRFRRREDADGGSGFSLPRHVSASISMTSQCCANRATSAPMQAALGNTCAHCL